MFHGHGEAVTKAEGDGERRRRGVGVGWWCWTATYRIFLGRRRRRRGIPEGTEHNALLRGAKVPDAELESFGPWGSPLAQDSDSRCCRGVSQHALVDAISWLPRP